MYFNMCSNSDLKDPSNVLQLRPTRCYPPQTPTQPATHTQTHAHTSTPSSHTLCVF